MKKDDNMKRMVVTSININKGERRNDRLEEVRKNNNLYGNEKIKMSEV